MRNLLPRRYIATVAASRSTARSFQRWYSKELTFWIRHSADTSLSGINLSRNNLSNWSDIRGLALLLRWSMATAVSSTVLVSGKSKLTIIPNQSVLNAFISGLFSRAFMTSSWLSESSIKKEPKSTSNSELWLPLLWRHNPRQYFCSGMPIDTTWQIWNFQAAAGSPGKPLGGNVNNLELNK